MADAMQQELDMIDESLCNLEARRTEILKKIEQKKMTGNNYVITTNRVFSETGIRSLPSTEIVF
jgi:chorismate mutase